jgi:hypothetical protein
MQYQGHGNSRGRHAPFAWPNFYVALKVLTLLAYWSTIASPGNKRYRHYRKLSGVSIHARPGSYALVTTDV